jgi:hypothetical protein
MTQDIVNNDGINYTNLKDNQNADNDRITNINI